MSEYLFDYSMPCQAGCGAQMMVPVSDLVRDGGAFCCPHCGMAYQVGAENLRLLAGLLAANFTNDAADGTPEVGGRP